MNELINVEGYRWLLATNGDGSQYPFLRTNAVASNYGGVPGDILIGARNVVSDGFTVYTGKINGDIFVGSLAEALAVSRELLAGAEVAS